MILDTVSHLARVRALVQSKAVGDAAGIKEHRAACRHRIFFYPNRRRRG